MTTISAVRAFLAARYPAAYDESMLLTRVNRAGAVDHTITGEELHKELITLSARHGHAELLTDFDGSQAWSATPAGVSAWTVAGSPIVGG